jgi:hypothetical protein
MMTVKDIVGTQGRVACNFLHLVFGCEWMGYQLDRLMGYLEGKRNRDLLRKDGQMSNKFEIKSKKYVKLEIIAK